MEHYIQAAKEVLNTDEFTILEREGDIWVQLFSADLDEYVNGELYDTIVARAEEIRIILDLPTRVQVNAERDRRIAETFTFAGKPFQLDEGSKQRVTGAATLAGFAMGAGAGAGFMRWANPDTDFAWIDANDDLMPMDAPTCFAFGQAAANHESAHVFAASALKSGEIPKDYTDDKYWP